PQLELVRLGEAVVGRLRLAQEGPCDEGDRRDGEHGADRQSDGHASAGTVCAYRAASRRSSRASGQSATSEPPTKTKPATQIRFTRGFTSTFRKTEPSLSI